MEIDASQECAGGVTAALGFTAGGIYCRYSQSKKDIAIVQSAKPAVVAGVFTLNKVVAAPLLWIKCNLKIRISVQLSSLTAQRQCMHG